MNEQRSELIPGASAYAIVKPLLHQSRTARIGDGATRPGADAS